MDGRGARGRRQARLILFIAIAMDAFVCFLFVSAPGSIGPPLTEPPSQVILVVPAIGIALNLIGLGWMVRIYRADPDAQQSSWRSTRS
jgi:hypothetical protein